MANALRDQGAEARPLVDLLQRSYRPGARFGQGRWLVHN